MWIPELVLFGHEMFTAETPRIDADPVLTLVLLGMLLAEIIGAVWAIVVTLKCVGEVQGFSAWMALGNLLLALAVLVVPLVLLALAIRFAIGG